MPIEVTTFYNEEEAFAKLLSGELSFDVWFPAGESIGKAVAGKLIQPLNRDYLPNLDQYVWPQLVNPFYDESQYIVPYVVYQTGIGWRNDMVDAADIEGIPNPWDVFWNPKYKGIIDLNPLILLESGCVAVDALVVGRAAVSPATPAVG